MSTCWPAGSSPGLRAEKGVIMKVVYFVGVALMLAIQAGAETYNWTDDNGTFNFTDDLSSVPRKYRSKARLDLDSDPLTIPDTAAGQQGKVGAEQGVAGEKVGSTAQGGKNLFGGRTLEDWIYELSQKESELTRLKQQLVSRKAELNGTVEERNRLMKEYNNMGTEYNQKAAAYNEVVEAARQAGVPLGTKK
jgi:hypothetical protein